jgi:hypothetical protein
LILAFAALAAQNDTTAQDGRNGTVSTGSTAGSDRYADGRADISEADHLRGKSWTREEDRRYVVERRRPVRGGRDVAADRLVHGGRRFRAAIIAGK